MKVLFERPGLMLLLTGVVALLVSRVIDWVPLIGGLIAFILLVYGIFAIVGGLFLAIKGPKQG